MASGFSGVPLVKTVRVGKKRSFLRGFLLTVVTFGIYGIYWSYKAPHEVYRQFDLEDEPRDEGIVWLVLGLVLAPLIFVYYWKATGNVKYVRDRLSLSGGVSPGKFVGLQVGGTLGLFVLIVLGLILASASLPSPPAGASEADVETYNTKLLAFLIPYYLLGLAVAIGTSIVAYFIFQTSINEVWDAWAERMRELGAPPAAPAATPAGFAAAPPTAPSTAPSPPAPPSSAAPPLPSAPVAARRRFKYVCRACSAGQVVDDTGERPLVATCAACGQRSKLGVP